MIKRQALTIVLTIYMTLGLFFFIAMPVSAQNSSPQSATNIDNNFKIPCTTKYCTLEEAINVFASIFKVIVILTFAGVILYGGFVRMTSIGNAEKIQLSQRIILAGIIGFAIIVFAQPIAEFVAKLLGVQGGLFSKV